MTDVLDTFFESQLQEWALARNNHKALEEVWCRELVSPKSHMSLHVQYNPARIVSTGASIDKAAIAARPCFLCAKNRPQEQQVLDLNEDFEWLVNPFPILPNHYTIASKEHRPQHFLDAYDAMIQAAKALPEGFIVFYNGPKCGASAPDHLHLQAGKWDLHPLSLLEEAPYLTYHIPNAESPEAFRTLYDGMPIIEGEEEPRMNVIAYRKGGHVSLVVIPRRAHRPHCYTAEGEAKYLISPGALDMCGLIVTPRKEDYERLTAAKAMDILCEVGIRKEPTIDVGIMQGKEIRFTLMASPLLVASQDSLGEINLPSSQAVLSHRTAPRRGDSDITGNSHLYLQPGTYCASIKDDGNNGETYIIIKGKDTEYTVEKSVMLESPLPGAVRYENTACGGGRFISPKESCEATGKGKDAPFFSLHNVTIGKEFHWQQQETQTFQGSLILRIIDGELHAINRIAIEDYLTSVIASEMSGTSSVELLKAHAVISRSWLLAQMASPKESCEATNRGEAIRWYDREAHTHFDVCADDHCQRYQGVSRKVTPQVHEAICATRGLVLSYEEEVCDARFSKCCGGRSELYESCWDDTPHPYLSVVDDPFCNTDDPKILSEVLNHYDQSTDFYRWTVEYTQAELSDLVRRKGGFDYGDIIDLIPIERGPSGRIMRLQIVGTKATRIIGKELEIRRTLSETHLYSSAFEVEKRSLTPTLSQGEGASIIAESQSPLLGAVRCESTACDDGRFISPKESCEATNKGEAFVLHGSGWGHGVGLCQIGAAVMGAKGYNYKEILRYYYPKAELTEWYVGS